MPRKPSLWYWNKRKAWYTQIAGKKIKLHEDEKEAQREFYRLMAAEGMLDDRQRARVTVADACEAMIAQASHHRPSTVRVYRDKLGPFAAAFQHRRLDSIRPDEVIRLVSDYRGTGQKGVYGDSSKALMFRHIKSLFVWARDTGLLERNVFARVPNPWRIADRSEPMTEVEYRTIMDAKFLGKQYKEVVEFVYKTGIRQGELVVMSARHLDANRAIARFQPSEHKTGTKTGLQREVFFPPDLWAKLLAYADLRPTGPLLRRRDGKPWTVNRISRHFTWLRKKLGLKCVLYQARHSFATILLDSGVPQARAAKILGHNNPRTIMKTYYHPDTEQMLSDVEKASRVAEIRQKVEETRANE